VPNDGAPRITTAELKEFACEDQAVVIDVRNEASYNAGHIRGAKLIRKQTFPSFSELPKDKLIVTTALDQTNITSARVVVDLKAKGINNAAALLGGFAGLAKCRFTG